MPWLARAYWRLPEQRRMVRRLIALPNSPVPAHRQAARAIGASVMSGRFAAARTMIGTAVCEPDVRAEKIVFRRYAFVWICNPKVASRSIIAALCAVDSEATVISTRTMDDVFARYPEAKGYFTFAFMRDPCERTLSAYLEKLVRRPAIAEHLDILLRRFHGLGEAQDFPAFCRWLNTPFGSDAFADRHWLSQNRQIRIGGRLPDFVGRYESLDADWREVASRIGMPHRPLPRLNSRPNTLPEPIDDATVALLRSRYAEDFDLWRGLSSA